MKIFRPHFTDRAMQKFGHLFPSHLPARMKSWRDKYEHHLLLKWPVAAWPKHKAG